MAARKKTVLVVTGSRAEYGLLRPIMREIQKSKKLALKVLVTGAHTLASHGKTQSQVEAEFTVDCVVPIREAGAMTEALGEEIRGIGEYCAQHCPDLILVNGDRDESFAGAIVGGHLGIPVAHIHGGDKTGWVVDEYIRHATTKFSHLHFAATKKSAQRIKWLGEESWRVVVSGGPGLDEIRTLAPISKEEIGKKYGLDASVPWTIVLHHPTSLDTVSYKEQIAPLLKEIAKLPGEKIIGYPNSDTGSREFITEIDQYRGSPHTHIFKSIPREDYLVLFKNASLLVGNSSMGIIDSSYLKVPTVNVGNRQSGREKGVNVVDAQYDATSIAKAIKRAQSSAFRARVKKSTSPYGNGHAASRIVQTIERHIDRSDLFHKKLTYV